MTMALTLRFPDDDEHRDFGMVARIDGQSMNDAILQAIREHVAARRADPEFQKRLRALMDENEDVLRRLTTPHRDERNGR